MSTKPDPIKYPPQIRHKYPHMRPADVRIWEAYLLGHTHPNAQVAYDVHVGSTPSPPPNAPEYLVKHIEAVYPKKIDAVIYLLSETIVAEVKPFAGLTALGQALGGRLLFHRDYPLAPNPIPAIITDTAQPDIPWLCARLGIVLIEVPPVTPPP